MKNKYIATCEDGFNSEDGSPKLKQVKKFKNEPEALAFFSDSRNQSQYRNLRLNLIDKDKVTFEYDERKGSWQRSDH